MGKRSNFERRKNDVYDTTYDAVLPLLPHLEPETKFIEPCAGKGDLLKHLCRHGHFCTHASDIAPRRKGIKKMDALDLDFGNNARRIITNPPWERKILHAMIARFSWIAPTWLLFDSDWMFTKQSRQFLNYCPKIISVGRISWMGNGKKGKDNCAWYLFDRQTTDKTVFYNQ